MGGLYLADAASSAPCMQVFKDSLQKYGWAEGRNVRIDARWAAGQFAQLKNLAAEFVRAPVDVICTASNIETAVARQATSTIPIVMLVGADPVGAGFAKSLAKPSGNVTGLSFDPTPEIFGKHLELLRELVPTSVRVVVIRNPSLPGGAAYWDAARVAARGLKLELDSVAVEALADIKPMLSAISRERGDAVFVFGDPITFSASAAIAEAGLRNRMPVISSMREYTAAGGLASYGVHLLDACRRQAVYVDKILRGAKPGELPIEQPTKFELVVNVKTAKSLGLTVPGSVLLRVDHVIE